MKTILKLKKIKKKIGRANSAATQLPFHRVPMKIRSSSLAGGQKTQPIPKSAQTDQKKDSKQGTHQPVTTWTIFVHQCSTWNSLAEALTALAAKASVS